jgi:LmbE family N-acetylglucosaminyl deacetylase
MDVRIAAVLAAFAAAAVSCTTAQTSPAAGPERAQTPPSARTLLAVFAHPDDETMAGPMLARYARQGARVFLVSATDGEKGVMPHANVPGGGQLAAVRKEEAACAAAKLGAQAPVFLGMPDGGLNSSQALAELERKLKQVISDLKPDAIVTWGPDGGYGHPDHRMVSAVLTQIAQAGGPPLYYAELPLERIGGANRGLRFPTPFAGVQERYLNVRIAYAPADAAAASASLACHASHFTPESIQQISRLSELINGGVQYLRGWAGGSAMSDILN